MSTHSFQWKRLQYVVPGTIILVILIWLWLPSPAARASDPTPEAALADINAWRAEAGVLPVTEMRPDWNEGCRLHNQYLALQGNGGGSSHDEDPASPYYTAAGAEAGESSVLSGGQALPKDAWSRAIYHRVQLLNPRLSVSGFDASNGRSCMRTIRDTEDNARATPEFRFYPWPPDGAQGVETTFVGHETPNPRDYDTNGGEMGYLLSVNINGPWAKLNESIPAAIIAEGSLVSDSGSPITVAARPIYPAAIGLLPIDPLQPYTGYTARAVGHTRYKGGTYPYDLSWHFQTGAPYGQEPEPEADTKKPGSRSKHRKVRRHRHCHTHRRWRHGKRRTIRHCHRHKVRGHHRHRRKHRQKGRGKQSNKSKTTFRSSKP